MIKPLSTEQALALLAERGTGRLGCVANGSPYVVPVNYIFQDGKIYSHSLLGQKIQAFAPGPASLSSSRRDRR